MFDFIADVVESIGTIGEIAGLECIMREPRIQIEWDWEEGKPKLVIKDRDPFDPLVH